MHQPLGLILPVTTWQLAGGLKRWQAEHFSPFLPGLFWYLNCALLSDAESATAVAPVASKPASAGSTTKCLSASPRVRLLDVGFIQRPPFGCNIHSGHLHGLVLPGTKALIPIYEAEAISYWPRLIKGPT